MYASTLTAADYREWCQVAALYIRNVSHADRYRTFQQKISPAGLTTVIVHDFLESHHGGIDLQTWRNSDVYEMGNEATYRIEQTALALEAIGAPRVAGKIRTLRNTSPFAMLADFDGDYGQFKAMTQNLDPAKLMEELRANIARAMPDIAEQAGIPMPGATPIPVDHEIETREQIEYLLARFVHANESALRADMAQHGDPRAKPGFDPKHREQEIERIRHAEFDHENQREAVAKILALMDRVEHQLANNPNLTPSKAAKDRRALRAFIWEYEKRPPGECLPETQKCLKQAQRLQKKYPNVFQPTPIDDKKLLERLAGIGAYDADIANKVASVSWDQPVGLTADWTRFSLTINFPANDSSALHAILDAYDRLRERFPQEQQEIRAQVVRSFDIYREELERWGLEDYELDAEGQPTEASILQHAGNGSICLSVYESDEEDDVHDVHIQVFFGVDWDEEHGLEIGIDDEPPPGPTDANPTNTVSFRESGPAIGDSAIAAFERNHAIQLPADYRAFLLQQNGGIPEPNCLKLKMDGASMPVYVNVLYSLAAVGEALALHLSNGLPAHYLPIGTIKTADTYLGSQVFDLLLVVTGKSAGKVFVSMLMPGMNAAMMQGMFEACCRSIAPSFSVLLTRLTQRHR
jgi:hypothetical protein